MPVIEINNLSYVYNSGASNGKKALDNITLSVEKGEFLGIVGGNGSGKSTLIQHFNGLLYPQSGSISVLGYRSAGQAKGKRVMEVRGPGISIPRTADF
jgi:energy-coupling factor transport system ATP-binding protein